MSIWLPLKLVSGDINFLCHHKYSQKNWILSPFYTNSNRGCKKMGKLFKGFKILCTDFDHILEIREETIHWIVFKGVILFKGGY